MARDFFTDEQVEEEIERLSQSEAVLLARQEQRIKYRRRQYMYQLRNYEKRGKELQKLGITYEDLKRLDVEVDGEGDEK